MKAINVLQMLSIITLFIMCSSLRQAEDISTKIDINLGPNDQYEILKIIPRNITRYTQGLFFSKNSKYLYESGGLYQSSSLLKMEYPSLKIVKEIMIDRSYFGEGIAKCGDFLYQLTWQEKKILKYNYKTMQFLETISMPLELEVGWGLSSSDNENELFATNGSNQIFRLDCSNKLKVKSKISVTNKGKSLTCINDFTYANNFIWANVYFSSIIYKINPNNGKIIQSYDMKPIINYEISQKTLKQGALNSGDVLNGICYDEVNKRFIITGKRWGHFYEVNFK